MTKRDKVGQVENGFSTPSGFTALRSARRQNFGGGGLSGISPEMVHQGPGGPGLKEGAGRRPGGRRSACRRSSRWRKAGASRRPARNNALNRRRTIYIREAKSPRPSPIHTLITHQPHRASGQADPGAPAQCSTRAGPRRRGSSCAPPRPGACAAFLLSSS